MTDIPSGIKRSYEGEHEGTWLKRRRDDNARSRDRRDSYRDRDRDRDRDSISSFKRDRSREKERSRGGYHRDDDYRRRHSGEPDRHRERDRDRTRDKDYGRSISKDTARRRDNYGERNGHSRHRSRSRPLDIENEKPVDVLNYKDGDSEMEEGEIVSVPPPSHRGHVPRESPTAKPLSSQHTHPPTPPEPKPEPKQPPQQQPEIDITTPQEEPDEVSLEKQMAARRARREAIRAKYAATTAPTTPVASQFPSQSPREQTPVTAIRPMIHNLTLEEKEQLKPSREDREEADGTPGLVPSGRTTAPAPASRSTSPAANNDDNAFSLAKDEPETIPEDSDKTAPDGEQISAADYDPNQDRKEDEERRVRDIIAKNELHGDNAMDVVEEEVVQEVEEEEEDVDDMFAIITNKTKKTVKVTTKKSIIRPVIATTTLDSAADPEGYYQIILGEQLDNGKYQVFSSLGKGMFSNVVRARILNGEGSEIAKEVAIKIIRAQESMHRAGLKEVQIINKLRQADPDDKKHIVRLERTFEHRGHLCLVFESLSMNLRDVIKRFGKDVGLNIRAVRAYTSQLFLALSLLRKSSIMHADIKPDNILVSENKTVVKICDFGSASDVSENDITPYLVSRFYRAPEIILGLPYDTAIDVWSIGCTLYELYTGKILFPGRSNNHMLLLIMELKGRFNSKMIKKAKFGDFYFDEMGGFTSVEKTQATGLETTRTVHVSKPTRDLRARLLPPASAKLKDDETKMELAFIDLLDKCLTLDPTRRLTPRDALMHPFVRGV